MEYTSIEKCLQLEVGSRCNTYGRIKIQRLGGFINFLVIHSEGFNIQLSVEKPFLINLKIGDYILITGTIGYNKKNEKNIKVVSRIELLNSCVHQLQKEYYTTNKQKNTYRYPIRNMIESTDKFKLIKQTFLLHLDIKNFFKDQGFLEVSTPILHDIPNGSDNLTPFVTHYNSLNKDMYLKVAPECYLKRYLIAGFERVFELSNCFRNEGVDRSHKPEFYMLEAYSVMSDLNFIKSIVEDLIVYLFKKYLPDQRLNFCHIPYYKLVEEFLTKNNLPKVTIENSPFILQQLNRLENTNLEYDFSCNFKLHMFEYFIFSEFVERKIENFTFVDQLPNEVSQLARIETDKYAFRSELFYKGVEIANMCYEKIDPYEQDAILKDSKFRDENFVYDMYYGLPPCSGLGIGIDRIVMILLEQNNIRDITPFPQLKSDE